VPLDYDAGVKLGGLVVASASLARQAVAAEAVDAGVDAALEASPYALPVPPAGLDRFSASDDVGPDRARTEESSARTAS
jgi:hypothetical protein